MGTTALVTGASSGLGVEFARLFAADGVDLVLVARRRERLEALATELRAARKASVQVIAADLAVPGEVERVIAEVQNQALEIEFLVNNAGLGNVGAFAGSALATQLVMVDVNVRALVRLTHAFLPAMLARRRGRVLNIGSTAGLQPGPYGAVYYASKAFVNSFTEALAHELKGTGVTATVSLPGATATEFASVAGSGETACSARASCPPRWWRRRRTGPCSGNAVRDSRLDEQGAGIRRSPRPSLADPVHHCRDERIGKVTAPLFTSSEGSRSRQNVDFWGK
jgi:short-subunit dehydrogenase